jgi:hypothetical protein
LFDIEQRLQSAAHIVRIEILDWLSQSDAKPVIDFVCEAESRYLLANPTTAQDFASTIQRLFVATHWAFNEIGMIGSPLGRRQSGSAEASSMHGLARASTRHRVGG